MDLIELTWHTNPPSPLFAKGRDYFSLWRRALGGIEKIDVVIIMRLLRGYQSY
jgi:hypothetical protein